MSKPIQTDLAPQAIGTYSQAIQTGNLVFLSGQIPLNPTTMELIEGPPEKQISQVFENIKAVVTAAGGSLEQVVKLTIYLTDLNQFHLVNEIMATYFTPPYPARAAIEVAALPKGAGIEIDGILAL